MDQENNSLALQSKRLRHDITLDENNYREIVHMNIDGVLEELCGYLGPKKGKNTKKIWCSSEHPVATSRQPKCDTISGK